MLILGISETFLHTVRISSFNLHLASKTHSLSGLCFNQSIKLQTKNRGLQLSLQDKKAGGKRSARNFMRTFIWAFCESSRWIIMKSGGSEIKSNPFGFPSSFQIKTLNLSQCQQSHVSSLFPMMLPCVWGEGAAAGERGESGETPGDGGAVRVAVSTATLLDVLCQEVGTSSVNFWPDWTEFYNHTQLLMIPDCSTCICVLPVLFSLASVGQAYAENMWKSYIFSV